MLSVNDTLLLTFYTGEYECANGQRVILTNTHKTIELETGTGNPVLFTDNNGDHYILYSKFVEHSGITHRVMKWMFCDLYVRKITSWTDLTLEPPIKISDNKNNLLGRCKPLIFDNRTILPLYDELNGCCVLYGGSGGYYEEFVRFGPNEIQPAIWEEKGEIYALSRNFRSDKLFSNMTQISVLGSLYSSVSSSATTVPNNNSSIAVLPISDTLLYVYNNTTNKYRSNLSLGLYLHGQFCHFLELDAYGSYPCAIRHKDGIAISYTTFYKKIAVKWFKTDDLFYQFQYSTSRRCKSFNPQADTIF